jgi:hypothetical protein
MLKKVLLLLTLMFICGCQSEAQRAEQIKQAHDTGLMAGQKRLSSLDNPYTLNHTKYTQYDAELDQAWNKGFVEGTPAPKY